MTELESLKYIKLFREEWDVNSKTKNAEALDVAIKALEEQIKIKSFGDCYIIPRNGLWEVNGVDVHKAIEKRIAKKPFKTMDKNNPYYKYMPWCCPCCRETLYEDTEWGYQEFDYCTECGQKLDWSDEDDNH